MEKQWTGRADPAKPAWNRAPLTPSCSPRTGIRVYDARVRNRLPLVVGLATVLVAVLVIFWLRRPGDERAVTAGSGAVTTAKPATGPRPPAQPASVAGRVTKQADGRGVAGAVVSLARAELGAELSSTTVPTVVVTADANGAWEAKNVRPGDFMIAATAKGMLPSAREKLTIASGEQRTGIDIALAAGGTLVTGTVSDVGGGPIGGARVTAKRAAWSLKAGAEFVTVTGADGTYELSLPDGSYRLNAEHDDYTRDGDRAEVAGKPITVDFTLIPGAVIQGQVIARDTRQPVPGAIVSAGGGRGGGGRRGFRDSSATTDDEGRFVMRGLASGSVTLTARGRGYASASPTAVQLGIGEQVEDVQVLVDGAFSIIGRVVKKGTEDGIAGARLGAFSMTGDNAEALAPTDETGAFEIPGLRPGSLMLFAAAEGSMLEIGKSVEIVDRDVTGVVVELATGVTISGRIEPPAVATVGLELEGEVGLANMFEMIKTVMVKAESDASGAFTLTSVPPGKFKISAFTKDGSTGKLPVVIASVDQTGLVVQLQKRASIAGRVIDTNGKPVAGQRVTAEPDEKKGMNFSAMMMDRGNVESAADGTFKIVGLDPGKYEVGVRDFESMMRMKDKDRKRNLVELAEGAEKTGVTITVEARDGVIRGVVIGADGKPTGDAWVTAYREREKTAGVPEEMEMRFGRSQSEPALTGGDGKFVITKLRAGKYTLVAEGPRGSSRGKKRGVNAGETTQLQLASLGTLVVTVTQRGAPTTSYDLSCESPAHDVERHAASDDGSYKLENLPPGEYECKVSADSGTAEGKVTVPTSEAKLALSLSMFGSLTGTVVSVLTAKPIPDLDVIANTDNNPKGFLEAMTGKGVKTDAQGKFVVERVPAGKGKLMLAGKGGFGSMESHDYVAKEGEKTDLGLIKIVPPRTTEAGTYGFSLEVKDGALEVTSVTPGTPAEGAGIVVGDKITTVEMVPVAQIGAEIVKKLLSSGTVGVGQTVRLGLEKGSVVSVTSVKW